MAWRDLPRGQRDWLVVAGVTALVFALLAVLSVVRSGEVAWTYLLGVLLTMALYALFALGLSIEFGYAGLLNFGHAAFMGLGAYGMAVLSLRVQSRLAPALEGWTLGGFLVGLLVAALAGLVALVPSLLLAERVGKRLPRRTRAALGFGAALLVALLAFLGTFPMEAQGARNAVTLLGILVGVALAAVVALVLGFPAIRLREDYLAIVMIGSAEIMRAFAANEEWLTKGTLGILNLQRPVVDWASETQWWRDLARALDVRPVLLAHAALALLAVAFTYLLLQTLVASPWGRVLKAIREDEEVAAALGKNVALYKLQALMLGAAVAAVAGVLLAWHSSNVFPDDFAPIVTFYAFIILVLGGVGNHKGAILGSVLLWGILQVAGSLTFLQRYGIDFAGPLEIMFIGIVLILVMVFRPQGAVGSKEEMVLGK